MKPEIRETKLQEYEKAQDMVKHYDSLTLQTGSILVSGVLVLTGVILNGNLKSAIEGRSLTGLLLISTIPFLSLFLLLVWQSWYKNYSFQLNLRNETLQRLEQQLGMYHYLRAVQADIETIKYKTARREKRLKQLGMTNDELDIWIKEKEGMLEKTRLAAGYGPNDGFEPTYPHKCFPGRGTDSFVHRIVYGIFFIQFSMLVLVWLYYLGSSFMGFLQHL